MEITTKLCFKEIFNFSEPHGIGNPWGNTAKSVDSAIVVAPNKWWAGAFASFGGAVIKSIERIEHQISGIREDTKYIATHMPIPAIAIDRANATSTQSAEPDSDESDDERGDTFRVGSELYIQESYKLVETIARTVTDILRWLLSRSRGDDDQFLQHYP